MFLDSIELLFASQNKITDKCELCIEVRINIASQYSYYNTRQYTLIEKKF